jgi:AraC-like DNA-binding protein
MSKFDRLSALMQHFQMSVTVADSGQGNLIVFGDHRTNRPAGIEFWPQRQSKCGSIPLDRRLFEAKADWGGDANPLIAALPEKLVMDTDADDSMALLLQMLVTEAIDDRCGSASALNRLCEVLIIRLLRRQIELGATTPGLLSGLADVKLSRALVAMHEQPGRDWRNNELAEAAGMSLSRFSDRFVDRVGETPQSYLRRWRMILARQEIAAGQRIQSVARRLGYGSSEALSRAFSRHFGKSPILVRKSARTGAV